MDRVFKNGKFPNPEYCARRAAMFVVAVNCVHPSGSCFCASMGTGPRASSGFDLALTEVVESRHHYFLVDVGSKAGEKVLASLTTAPATDEELNALALWLASLNAPAVAEVTRAR